MSRVLVIGCGGVASVAISKCCQVSEVFTELCIASRTKEKCDALEEKLRGKRFTRCNSCYLVNLAYVDTVKGYQLLLKDGTELQISQPKKKTFMQAVAAYEAAAGKPV